MFGDKKAKWETWKDLFLQVTNPAPAQCLGTRLSFEFIIDGDVQCIMGCLPYFLC